ncbi:hypothetical protein STANM309S_01100 [Streptomyces tanashiensis]
MLAASLDQAPRTVTSAAVESEAENPSVELLARWFEVRLGVPVDRVESAAARSSRPSAWAPATGEIVLDRPEGSVARLAIPGQPDRGLALKVAYTAELIAEELRRLDPDEAYATALRFGLERLDEEAATTAPETVVETVVEAEVETVVETAPAAKPAAKKAPARKAAK